MDNIYKLFSKVLKGRAILFIFAIGSFLSLLGLAMAVNPLVQGLPVSNTVAISALFWTGAALILFAALNYIVELFGMAADKQKLEALEAEQMERDLEYHAKNNPEAYARAIARAKQHENISITVKNV